jgi:hypothetical protein
MNTATDSLESNTQKTGGGFVVGQSATDLIGFYGASPLAQPASADQAALTDNSVGTASTVIAALTGTYNSTLIVAAIASLAAQGNAIRNALVSLGIIKGSA